MPETYDLLSLEWIAEYARIWNENEAAIKGTAGLGALVEMSAADQDRPPVQINITVEGLADYHGPVQEGVEPFFKLTAPTETWRKVAKGEMGVRRAVTGPIKFQGSLRTALKYFSGLEAALLQFGDVPTTEWDA